jgi:hypothetical protein
MNNKLSKFVLPRDVVKRTLEIFRQKSARNYDERRTLSKA